MSTLPERNNVYRVKGLDPTSSHCSFHITLDGELARRLESLDEPDKQKKIAESVSDMYLDSPFTNIKFRGNSLLVTNITVAVQATGLDLTDEHDDSYNYYTHNVDSSPEAIEVLAVFEKCVDLGIHILEEDETDA